MEVKNKWQQLTADFIHEIENNLRQQHLAAQFVALAGRYLIPKKPDGSNINMQYLPEKEILLGNQHPDGWSVAVKLRNLTIQILDKNQHAQAEIPLDGKSFGDAFQEFKTKLQNSGIDISGLKTEQPYQLSTDALKEGKYFAIGSDDAISENIRYRNNARLIINELAAGFTDVEPVRIWPHHFDTGTFATLARNAKGSASKTIGMGWAIPDSMVSEPYFYISFWSENPVEIANNPSNLPAGKWMMPGWNGSVLATSEIIQKESAEGQYRLVKDFFRTGIDTLIKKLK
ncbi:hypothetical protein [Prolixibacter sp. NT017]|uniref:hypothetical protein n=1 Tax=Prolixibacter sp. NT017 TaxID=2652390 RepID=UPI00127957FC|nr:hypothetical protein [Prolixibacter sp. NT017]GET24417.1 hypothetical protein NT017_07460 [Prolixibacter sp. NT017]